MLHGRAFGFGMTASKIEQGETPCADQVHMTFLERGEI